jgi:hypothetical protein
VTQPGSPTSWAAFVRDLGDPKRIERADTELNPGGVRADDKAVGEGEAEGGLEMVLSQGGRNAHG